MTILSDDNLLNLPLHALHCAWQGRMVGFAGYHMPVQYADGIIKEHNQVRNAAGFFDISHMGQAFIAAENIDSAAQDIEKYTPADLIELNNKSLRYSQLLNAQGGIIDDLMLTRFDQFQLTPDTECLCGFYAVVNAACKTQDFNLLQNNLKNAETIILQNRCLFALQGPKAETVMQSVLKDACNLNFMHADIFPYANDTLIISRSGYTGEDGFEISVSEPIAETLARDIIAHPDCAPIGLGARDSLRLEAGLCLYGHDIDQTTSPVEAALTWSIGKRRKIQGQFPGDKRIIKEINEKPTRKRIGLLIEGKAPVREGCLIRNDKAETIGKITSGGFSPTLQKPIAMGYVEHQYAKPDTKIQVELRNKLVAATVTSLPFVAKRYKQP